MNTQNLATSTCSLEHNKSENFIKELYFIIAKFLSAGPCNKTYEVLLSEIENCGLVPRRIDWLGSEHNRTFNEYASLHSNVSSDHLLQLLSHLSFAVNGLVPLPHLVLHQPSLLARGKLSLLRKTVDVPLKYPTLRHVLSTLCSGHCGREPACSKVYYPNVCLLLQARSLTGSLNSHHLFTSQFYNSHYQLHKRTVGHLSSVYCVLFDRTGRYILTGSDDTLVKIWSVRQGRLLATLRGASGEISDIAIDPENTMVAAGCCDKTIRVWSLQTLSPIAVLLSHTGMITAVQFCPSPDTEDGEGLLVSTGGDGCVAFWTYTRKGFCNIVFRRKPLKYNERVRHGNAQLVCCSFSSGGTLLALGGVDRHVRVYRFGGSDGLEKVVEQAAHQDCVDSIQWSHGDLAFASGSRDGRAIIWRYEASSWRTTVLDVSVTDISNATPDGDTTTTTTTTTTGGARATTTTTTITTTKHKKLMVTMVGWSQDDRHVVTCSSDHHVRVWAADTGRLLRRMTGHADDAFVIEAHPTDTALVLTAGHDGKLIIWDILRGHVVCSFKNSIEGQGHGALFDAKWSPDGEHIAATDSHGHICIYGMGSNELHKKVPQELFFHTDYRPLVRDAQQYVLDEQTQLAPHLMPPPFLVNMDGNPYPPALQRLVPGRERCTDTMLVPNVIFNDNGEREVFDLGEINAINALHHQAANNAAAIPDDDAEEPPPLPSPQVLAPLPPLPADLPSAPSAGPATSSPVRTVATSPLRYSRPLPPSSPAFLSPGGNSGQDDERPRLLDQMIERLVQEQQAQINHSFGAPDASHATSDAAASSGSYPEASTSAAATVLPVPLGSLTPSTAGSRPSVNESTSTASASGITTSSRRASDPAAVAGTSGQQQQPPGGVRIRADHSYAQATNGEDGELRASRGGSRLVGDVEGVRQSSGNWQRGSAGGSVQWSPFAGLVQPLRGGLLRASRQRRQLLADQEEKRYLEESAKQRTAVTSPEEANQVERDSRAAREHDSSRTPVRRRARQRIRDGTDGPPQRSLLGSRRAPRARVTAQGAHSRRPNREVGRGRYSTDYEDPNTVASDDSNESDNNRNDNNSRSVREDASEAESNASSSSESSSGQSSDYSDWTAEQGVNLEPPKRTAHRQKKSPSTRSKLAQRRNESRAATSGDDDDDELNTSSELQQLPERSSKRMRKRNPRYVEDEDNAPGPSGLHRASTSAPSPPLRQRRVRERINNMNESSDSDTGEVPEGYRPPEWLTETQPKRAPYFPQMGDQLMYFRHGHMLYVEAVIKRKLYPIETKTLPWFKPNTTLRDCEYVKIIGIKYEIRPPRLCCLKLGIMDPNTCRLSTDTFTLKYHDIPDVLDFFILKQMYDVSASRHWQPGDRFRCIIDDAWWLGTVERREPALSRYPDSLFMCYNVTWDNGEKERLSPWDMEPIDETVEVGTNGTGIVVCSDELARLRYSWTYEDWLEGRDGGEECARISRGLGMVMGLAAAEPFLAPVDLSAYPNYAMMVEYPMDLSTIKSRLDNGFYRRLNAVQFDVRYIATNAEKFNQRGSNIVRQARIVTELCLYLIKNPSCRDPTARYHEIASSYQSPNASDHDVPGPSRMGAAAVNSAYEDEGGRKRKRPGGRGGGGIEAVPWEQQCRDVLRTVFEREDSMPFRYPVDLEQYPDYSHIVEVPMDLTSIREELSTKSYESPLHFASDMRLIFTNSKSYNTNKKSKIYSMTVRLEAFFEEKIKAVIANYEAQEKLAKKGANKRNLKLNLLISGSASGPSTSATRADYSLETSSSSGGHTLRSPTDGSTLTLTPTSVRLRRLTNSTIVAASSSSTAPSRQVNGVHDTDSEDEDTRRSAGKVGKRVNFSELEGDEDGDTLVARRSKPRVVKLKRLPSSDDSDEDYSPVKKRVVESASKVRRRSGATLPRCGSAASTSGDGGGMGVRSRVAVQYQEDSLSEIDDYERLTTSTPRNITTAADSQVAPAVTKTLVNVESFGKSIAVAADVDAAPSTNVSTPASPDVTESDDAGAIEANSSKDSSDSETSDSERVNKRINSKRKRLLKSDSDEETNDSEGVNKSSNGKEKFSNKNIIISGNASGKGSANKSSKESGSDSNSSHDSSSSEDKPTKSQKMNVKNSSSESESSSFSSDKELVKRQLGSNRGVKHNGFADKKKIVPNIGRKMPIYKGSLIPSACKRKKQEDSEFECDDNDFVSSEYSEEEDDKPKKGNKRRGASVGRRTRKIVLDSDDLLEDEDFVVDDDFIDNEGASDESESSSSSEESNSDDSYGSRGKKNYKKKKKKHSKGIVKSSANCGKKIPLKCKPSSSASKRGRGSGKKIVRHKKSSGRSVNGAGSSISKGKRKRLHGGGSFIQEVRDGDNIIGTVRYDSSDEDASSDEYAPSTTVPGKSGSKRGKGRLKHIPGSNTMGGFKRAIDALREDEVRKSSRAQKKVRYDEMYEDDDEEDDLNVSSRGRVRRANTLMKDFI